MSLSKPKIIATSDLHGALPEIPECDILLVGGDLPPAINHSLGFQLEWLMTDFYNWLKTVPATHKIWIAGNHDFVLEKMDTDTIRDMMGGTYLLDETVEVEGLRIHGTPWTPNLPDWAFPAEGKKAIEKFAKIPECDILLSHGPPRGFGDIVPDYHMGYAHCGSELLQGRIRELEIPIVVCGHIHEGYGLYHDGVSGADIYCVSHMNRAYEPVNPPVEIIHE